MSAKQVFPCYEFLVVYLFIIVVCTLLYGKIHLCVCIEESCFIGNRYLLYKLLLNIKYLFS